MNPHEPSGNARQPGCNPTASLAASNAHAEPPAPPARLMQEERAVWLETTQSVRPDWFLGSEGLLEVFCRSTVIERRLAALVREADPLVDEDFATLVKLHRGAAMTVGNLAGKLRLTVRSTRERDTRKLPRGSDVWEVEPGPMPS